MKKGILRLPALTGRMAVMRRMVVTAGMVGLVAAGNIAMAQIPYPGKEPGKAQALKSGNVYMLENNVLRIGFRVSGGRLTVTDFTDKGTGKKIVLNGPLFELTFSGKGMAGSGAFVLKRGPVASEITGDKGPSYGKALGKVYSADLEDASRGLTIHWEAALKDDANYVRQSVTLEARDSVKVGRIRMVKLPALSGAKKMGTVDGSPLVCGNMFFATEHPMSQLEIAKTYIGSYLPRLNAVTAGHPFTAHAVWGVTPVGQLRRGFLYYVERERARPYHQMLHYNSWFDISWGDRKMDEAGCLDRIKAYGDSLINKRKVNLNAFLFDDGWDDNRTLWQFNSGFPEGFKNIKEAAAKYDAGIGVWISPWGGYDVAKEQRMEYGRKQNPPFETNTNGFSLAGPNYNKRFKEVTSAFISDANIAMFKFDGVGAGNGASGASLAYQKDIEAFLDLITGMRRQKPDIYFSLTVGTWPSVYWLNYGDAIWRAGDDTGLAGTGPKRQQWITYRDAEAYKNVVSRAPLYPLNSVMYHGICIADNGLPGELEMNDKDIADEIWAFFGSGTSLQELYVNPHKLNAVNWDCLRDAAKWSKSNEQVLSDVHWTGGDPRKGQVYGYAAWRNGKGTLMLRNSSRAEKSFLVNVREVFEVPAGKNVSYGFYDAKTGEKEKLYSGKTFTVNLKPYEVKVMNAVEE